MIIIEEKTVENITFFPKNVETYDKIEYRVTLYNDMTNQLYEFTVFDEDFLPDFYTFRIDYANCVDNEYEYTIYRPENEIIGRGMMRIGKLRKDEDTVVYNDEKTYKEYKF